MIGRCLVGRLLKLTREGEWQCITEEKYRIYLVGVNAKKCTETKRH